MTEEKFRPTTEQRYGRTDEFAREKLVKAQTVRKRYSATGSYYGEKPQKLPSGRLKWRLGGSK